MLHRLSLYWNTIRYMKPGQIYYRLRRMMHLPCTLGVVPGGERREVLPLRTVPELDFDPVFLARFPLDELMGDKITFFHESEVFHWEEAWSFPRRTPLWNYNLHYFEYLFPLVKAYKDTGDKRYFRKCRQMILAWIEQNPREQGGAGWDPYPVALRLTNWLSVYTYLGQEFSEDVKFCNVFLESVWNQYDCLARNLEKDLLGNHFFEDLKALILCALFFRDEPMLRKALAEFRRQCREQILPDGMHFELSPMYHNIIFEDVMRVAAALRGSGKEDQEIEAYLQPMLDVAYSFEEGLDRIPLFNDCGDNVAKSLNALCKAADKQFGLTPRCKDQFPDSGYYLFRQEGWKLIVDAGKPGPAYIPGHAHCDAMSFELFREGRPVLVNCGTYAYQCEERIFFKSTAAHNTVMVDGVEQSQCWGAFRMGKRARIESVTLRENGIGIQVKDQCGNQIEREIRLEKDRLLISDKAQHKRVRTYLHFADGKEDVTVAVGMNSGNPRRKEYEMPYAPEFGKKGSVTLVEISADERAEVSISFHRPKEERNGESNG